MSCWGELTTWEQGRLGELMRGLLSRTDWFGGGGLVVTDDIRVTIAGEACVLLLGLDDLDFRNVETIVVYPSTVLPKRAEPPLFYTPSVVPEVVPLVGEAHQRGPVILAWDAVQRGAARLEPGRDVVYHEFAHKLDQLDGAVDGTPPLADRAQLERWKEVIPREYEALRRQLEQGYATLLDPYATTNLGEFFAVTTECFFTSAVAMSVAHPELYGVLRDFYRQDPGARAWRQEVGVTAGIS
jgi:Mlc titration factor MtfA (ptsG expression regulator)